MARELLFKVTKEDCDWSFTRGTGKGGQKKNKTSSAVHCTHRDSGAHGYSETSRSQKENRVEAMRRMMETPEWKSWHRMEVARRTGAVDRARAEVELLMQPQYLEIECQREGKWVPMTEEAGE